MEFVYTFVICSGGSTNTRNRALTHTFHLNENPVYSIDIVRVTYDVRATPNHSL